VDHWIPALLSELALPDAPATVPLGPAVTTSRNELPVPGTLPLKGAFFSFVLDASDLESSGGGRDLGGGMVEIVVEKGDDSCSLLAAPKTQLG